LEDILGDEGEEDSEEDSEDVCTGFSLKLPMPMKSRFSFFQDIEIILEPTARFLDFR
jgi:hypothetical protein